MEDWFILKVPFSSGRTVKAVSLFLQFVLRNLDCKVCASAGDNKSAFIYSGVEKK